MLDLRQYGLRPGDVRRRRSDAPPGARRPGRPDLPAEPPRSSRRLELQASPDGLYMKLRSPRIVGPCLRCLEPARVASTSTPREYHEPAAAADGRRGADQRVPGRPRSSTSSGGRATRIVLALPEQILCRADCPGLCPHCGATERRPRPRLRPRAQTDSALGQAARAGSLLAYTHRLMAVPKRKTSKARRDKRRATHRISAPALSTCPHCHHAGAAASRLCELRPLPWP